MADNNIDDFDVENNKVDDLDFSDLDLDENEFGEGADFDSQDSGAPKGKKDYTSYIVYGLTGLVVLGIAAWQLDLFGGKEPEMFRADNVPMNNEIAAGAENLLPASNDPFNVLGTPDALPQDVSQDNNEQSPMIFDAMQPADSMPNEMTDTLSDEEAIAMAQQQANEAMPAKTSEGDIVPMPAEQPLELLGNTQITPAEALEIPAETKTEVAVDAETIIPEPAIVKPAETIAVVQEEVSIPVQTSMNATELTAIMDTLQTITARLDMIEKRVEDSNVKTSTSGTSSEELMTLQKTVTALESKLNQVEKKADNKPASSSTASAKKSSTTKTSSKPAPKKKSSSKWDQPYNGGAILENEASIVQNTPATNGYSLRAAQPGKAYIDDGSGNILEVIIGTAIPNMGQVTSIDQSNGQWMINTTQGIIK